MKQKKLLIIFTIIVSLAGASYGAWKFFGADWQWLKLQKNSNAPPETLNKTTPYGALPEIESTSNPLQNVPDLNPVEKTNPFRDAIKNPFE